MSPYRWIIVASWLCFVGYWMVSAVGVKRSADRRAWAPQLLLRLVLIVVIVALLRFRSLREHLMAAQHALRGNAAIGWLGAALSVLGFGVAIDARRHLGRNWGMPMARKEQPELVTSGPYAYIRHPIYSGLLLALLGSMLGIDLIGLPLPIIVGLYFVYSARREEAVMAQLFPQRYAAYRARTGMFLPCPLRRR